MSFKAIEDLKKKRVNRKALENSIDRYLEKECTFEISIEDEEGNSTPIKFKTFCDPMQLAIFVRKIGESGIVMDKGYAKKDIYSLALETHLFIIQMLSTMPVPEITVGDTKELDVQRLSVYGTYFLNISSKYEALFVSLLDELNQAVDQDVNMRNEMLKTLASGFDLGEVLDSLGLQDILSNKEDIIQDVLAKREDKE